MVVTTTQRKIGGTYNEGAIARISMDKTNRGMRNSALLPEAAREERGRRSQPPGIDWVLPPILGAKLMSSGRRWLAKVLRVRGLAYFGSQNLRPP